MMSSFSFFALDRNIIKMLKFCDNYKLFAFLSDLCFYRLW